jgi:murein hydrolase activator
MRRCRLSEGRLGQSMACRSSLASTLRLCLIGVLAAAFCPPFAVAFGQSAQSNTAQAPAAGALPSGPDDGLTRDEAEQQLDATKQQLESSRSQEQGLSRNVAALDQQRAELNAALISSGTRVQASEATLSATEQKLSDLTGQVNAIRKSISDRKKTIVEMLSAMQRIGMTPPPAFITPRKDALDAVRSAMLLAKVFPALKYEADTLSHQLDGLVALQSSIRRERDEQQQESDRLADEQKKLDRLLAQKKQELAENQSQLTSVTEIADRQAQQVTNLGDLIQRLDQKIARAQVAQYDAEVAAEQSLRARQQEEMLNTGNQPVVEIKPATSKVAFASPGRMQPAVPFDQAKGTLPLPVKGKWLSHFGDADELGGTKKGISLETRDDARVISPADGWVVYAGPFRSYGQLLILNAGEGYHVLLAGMNRIDVSVGQFVLAGEPVAEMGDAHSGGVGNGDRSGPALYVEFRKDGHPIDPDPWWAELSDKVQG